jgi:hypothetical protein
MWGIGLQKLQHFFKQSQDSMNCRLWAKFGRRPERVLLWLLLQVQVLSEKLAFAEAELHEIRQRRGDRDERLQKVSDC